MGGWSTPPLPAGIPAPDHSAFVGRAAELEVMERVWRGVADGVRRAVFVGGEPGVGKSRLVAEIAAALHGEGATVLWGSSYADLDVPYRPFITAVEGLLARLGTERARQLLPPEPEHLLRLTPRSADLLGDDLRVGEGSAPPVALFEAVAGLLEAVSRPAPVVLVLEDLHWSGPPTLQMLKHVVRSRPGIPLLILVTYRTTIPDRSAELSYALADLYPLEGVIRIDLAGLPVESIADLLAGETGEPRHRLLAPATVLRDQTAGNPFFLRELWRELAAGGGLAAVRSATTPATVRDTLDRRLAAFDREHSEVIELAAVAGQQVAVADLLAAGLHDRATTLAAIDVAVGAGLLVEDHTPGTYVFRHALVRRAVLDRPSPSLRAELHARMAAALGGRSADDPEVVARLAHHYEAAQVLGFEAEAAEHLTRVGRHAERSSAFADAAGAYLRAAAVNGLDHARWEALRLDAARCLTLAGDFEAAREVAEQLADSADPLVAVRAAIQHEDASWRPGRDGRRSLALLEAARDRLEPGRDDPLRIRADASTARALSFVGLDERARAVGERALAEARATGDADLLSHALACTLWRGMTPDLAPVLVDRASELADLASRRGDVEHLGPAGFYRAVFSYMLGDPEGWHRGAAEAEESARRTDEPFMRYVSACCAFAQAFAGGEHGRARELLGVLAGFFDEFGPNATEGSHAVQTFQVERATGGLEAVRSLITGEEELAGRWAPGLLAIYTELGLVAGARRVLPHVLAELDRSTSSSVQRAGSLAFATEAAEWLSDREAAEALRSWLSPYQGLDLISGQFVAVFGAADRYLGMVASVLGDPAADGHFEAALALDRRMRAVTHQIETLRAWLGHLRRHGAGSGRRAEALRVEADSLAERTGYRHREPVGPDAAPLLLPDDLTVRELDVLRLVARGLSNREIGEQLFISQNTAANHVRSILLKTGSPNRTSAAIYAADHGLLVDAGSS